MATSGELKRQLAMVMDLNKCLGCQSFAIACKRLWTRAGGKSELMNLLIGYRWTELSGGFDRDPATRDWKRA